LFNKIRRIEILPQGMKVGHLHLRQVQV